MLELREAATKHGVDLLGVKAGLNELGAASVPAIGLVDGDHFLVIDRITDSYVRVLDSSSYPLVLSRRDFAKRFSGYALVPADSVSGRSKRLRAWCDDSIVDVGNIGAGGEFARKFTIKTDSPTPIAVTDVRACCGAELKSMSGSVFSSDKPLEIVFRFRSPGDTGRLERTASVVLDGVAWPVINLSVVGWVAGSPTASPGGLDFGRFKRGTVPQRTLTLRYVDPEREHATRFVPGSACISVRKGKYDPENELLTAIVSLDISRLRGRVRDHLDIVFGESNDSVSVRVPIFAEALAPVSVWPPELMLGFVGAGQAGRASVTLSRSDGADFSILGIRGPRAVSARYSKADRGYTVMATVESGADFSVVDDCVTVITDVPDDSEIRIPVCAVREPPVVQSEAPEERSRSTPTTPTSP